MHKAVCMLFLKYLSQLPDLNRRPGEPVCKGVVESFHLSIPQLAQYHYSFESGSWWLSLGGNR
jgi:hypothetical protein